jgi:hypothetical protein
VNVNVNIEERDHSTLLVFSHPMGKAALGDITVDVHGIGNIVRFEVNQDDKEPRQFDLNLGEIVHAIVKECRG